MALPSVYVLHDDYAFLSQSIRSFRAAGPIFAFVSRTPWHGDAGDWEETARIAEAAGAEVILGDWSPEDVHRKAALCAMADRGFGYVLTPDGDEVIEPELLEALVHIAETGLADRVYVEWNTYWKSREYVIRPREPFTPLILLNLKNARHVHIRQYEGGRPLFLPAEHGIIHHLSYAGPDERIWRKITTWGHKDEIRPGWWEHVWTRWDTERTLRNLHPTHPTSYQFAERIPVPEILRASSAETGPTQTDSETPGAHAETSGTEAVASRTGDLISTERITRRGSLPKTIVVIPLCGGEDDIRICLDSLTRCQDLIQQVVVVDNASPDGAADIAESYPFVKVLRNKTNRGFAAACNQGFWGRAIQDFPVEAVLYLNSDTVVPRAGFIRLLEALAQSGSVGAVGPYTNYAGHGQQIEPTYTSLDTLDLFAEDFAGGALGQEGPGGEDREVDMLVGFCLAVKCSVLGEVALENGAAFDERFGMGLFEDNDLCYRIRRAGYRLLLAGRSYIHHSGSKTLSRAKIDAQQLLQRNHRIYLDKWRDDLESGYASHLSGLGSHPFERIVFDPAKHPDLRTKRIRDLARRADISCTMIVKNEERVLADCLKSIMPFFKEVIVVDTGSTDRTVEIAEQYGARVFHFPWTDSFAEARSEALKHATGRWVIWVDADDTLPQICGEALLKNALNAPRNVAGFVVPVQFVDDGSPTASRAAGTRVDHVKLFRNAPGLTWEGRIHEQIIGSLKERLPKRGYGTDFVRSEAVVLHSGYDTSVEGQKKKRERDMRLLLLDYEDRPRHPFVLFNIGMTYHYTGEHRRALRWLRRCIARSPQHDSHVRKAYDLLAVSLRELGNRELALETLDTGLKTVGDDPEMYFHKAQILADLGRADEAIASYQRVLQCNADNFFSSFDRGILGFKTFHNLGGLFLELKRYPQAREWLVNAVEAAPEHTPSAYILARAATDEGDYATARSMLQAIHQVEGPGIGWAEASSYHAQAIGGPANAAVWAEEALRQHPDGIGPRLIWSRQLLQNDRLAEAEPHLRWLADRGVAEAARNLGVMHVQRGDFGTALSWMERALAIQPDDPAAREQSDKLREALGIPEDVPGLPLPEALAQVAASLELHADELIAFAEEDRVGGYEHPHRRAEMEDPWWPGGCVWDVEGKVLYALVRAAMPKTIVEIGSLIGCSTSHLAEACARNGQGTVLAVDPFAEFSRVTQERMRYIQPVCQDVFDWTPPEQIDFVFEDGTHEPGFTRAVLEKLKPFLAPGAIVCCHDGANVRFPHVFKELSEVMGPSAIAILPAPSDCGLGCASLAPDVFTSDSDG